LKVAAYQAPLLPACSSDALGLIRERVKWCESEQVSILCCPEAILGGLADYADGPIDFAVTRDELEIVLAPLASDVVTTIIGFTESTTAGLYNSAAVFERGKVIGVYRKIHPAINRSIYQPGSEVSVFTIDGLTFGIVICYDSTFPDLAERIAQLGARALFIPTNNGLPPEKGGPKLSRAARESDQRTAVNNGLWIIRADVAGKCNGFSSHGSSTITSPSGELVRVARPFSEDLLVMKIFYVGTQK
jgi:predicted amidohydrolase